MNRQVLYVCHPVAPTAEEVAHIRELHRNEEPVCSDRIRYEVEANVANAMRWLAWLRRNFPETTFIAPWIASIQSGENDADPKQREAGLVDACAVVERCDGVVLVGGRISSGMRRKMDHRWGKAQDGGPFQSEVYSLADLKRPPLGEPRPTFREWARAHEAS